MSKQFCAIKKVYFWNYRRSQWASGLVPAHLTRKPQKHEPVPQLVITSRNPSIDDSFITSIDHWFMKNAWSHLFWCWYVKNIKHFLWSKLLFLIFPQHQLCVSVWVCLPVEGWYLLVILTCLLETKCLPCWLSSKESTSNPPFLFSFAFHFFSFHSYL